MNCEDISEILLLCDGFYWFVVKFMINDKCFEKNLAKVVFF